ncbi:MAG TPA: hypothetical protein VID47_06010, partial [Actinomycetota bacterium]
AQVVGISPDGTQVMLTGQPAGSSIPDTVEVVRVADGSLVASAAVSALGANGASLGSIGNDGDWTGDLVVADTGAGLALLRVGSTITVDRVIGYGVHEPQFVAGDPRQIVGWTTQVAPGPGPGPALNAVVSCAESGGDWTCAPSDSTAGRLRPVRSLSRPAALHAGSS